MDRAAVNDAAREMMGAVARWYKDEQGALLSAGTSTAYTLTTNSGNAALADMPRIVFRAHVANTGAATLNVDGLGAKAIQVRGAALEAGAIPINSRVLAIYNGTLDVFELIYPVPLASTGVAGISEWATAAEFRNNTASRTLVTQEVWSSAAIVALIDAVTIAVDMTAGFNFSVTIAGNRTLGNPTNTKVGQAGAIVVFQDGTGNRTLAYGTNWEAPNAAFPVLSTAAGSKSIIFYWVQSSTSIVITGFLPAVS